MNNDDVKYSIIIPTFNEEHYISSLLKEIETQSATLPYKIEIIIADGKSSDQTVEICNKFDTNIVYSPKGRGSQLKKGAVSARGEIFIFLHADLSIPPNMFLFIDKNFIPESDIAVFKMRYSEDKMLFKIYSFFTQFESVFSTFGDQGLVVAKKRYNEIGGFKDIPVMEDVEFFRKARKSGHIKKFNEYITASTRKFKERGMIKTQLLSFILIVKYFLGGDPQKIYEIYYKEKHDEETGSNYFCKISGAGES